MINNDNFNKLSESDKQENFNIANDLAQEKGYEGVNELVNDLNTKMKSTRNVERASAQTRAAGYVSQLIQLVLQQEIDGTPLNLPNNHEKLINYFYDGELSEGNSRTYDFTLLTGTEDYSVDRFIPDKVSSPMVEAAWTLSMYKANGDLEDNAFQFRKPLTITEAQWLPYFKAGKLAEFIAKIRLYVRQTYRIFLFNKIATLLTTSNPQTSIQDDNSGNMFECMQRVGVIIQDMMTQNTKYNYQANNAISWVSNREDLMLISNVEIISKLKSGVGSRLFNANFLIGEGGVIPYDALINLGNKWTVPNSSTTALSVQNDTPYVDNQTIWIVNKNAIKYLTQIDRTVQQEYGTNMTIQIELHVWGVMGLNPYGQIVKYTSTKLPVTPTGDNSTGN